MKTCEISSSMAMAYIHLLNTYRYISCLCRLWGYIYYSSRQLSHGITQLTYDSSTCLYTDEYIICFVRSRHGQYYRVCSEFQHCNLVKKNNINKCVQTRMKTIKKCIVK